MLVLVVLDLAMQLQVICKGEQSLSQRQAMILHATGVSSSRTLACGKESGSPTCKQTLHLTSMHAI